jgi:hypothetical protein
MTERATDRELRERLNLIENMIAEGRRSMGHWGCAFVLWGAAYYVAFAWGRVDGSGWAWPVTMIGAGLVTAAVASRSAREQPRTTVARAVGAIWAAVGISMFLLFLGLGIGGRLTDPHLFLAVSSAFLAVANGASALLLRWKIQGACAGVWWVASVACGFGTETQSAIVFCAAIFVCQIAFGVYVMIAERQARGRRRAHDDPAHA